ncbi:MAG TPA: BON domain-containing protein [Terriglobales bacterium]|nr:BON domain-containing protein [Terriglobales bacterium]
MKKIISVISSLLLVGLLSASVVAQTTHATRYDATIRTSASQKFASNQKFQNVKSSVEDGIVTLTGTVNLFQDKLDAAKTARKLKNAQGVRNRIEVAGPAVTDAQLTEQLSKKIYYDRVGWYDSAFNYFTLNVKDGVVTLGGETYNDVGRDSALAIAQRMPGVKDLVNEVKVSPTSTFDDSLRLRAMRAIYGYSSLTKYAIDPARPIRIIVDNGHISLYGAVDSTMDKQLAGMRASQLPGAFSVQNNLLVDNGSKQGL